MACSSVKRFDSKVNISTTCLHVNFLHLFVIMLDEGASRVHLGCIFYLGPLSFTTADLVLLVDELFVCLDVYRKVCSVCVSAFKLMVCVVSIILFQAPTTRLELQ